jgi:TonB family protein
MIKLISLISPAVNQEQTSLGKGWVVSLVTHIVFLALLCLPFLVAKVPPPDESEGLLVNLGLQDQGQGTETPKGETKELTQDPTPQNPKPEVKPMAAKSPAKETAEKSITNTEDSGVAAREAAAKQKAQADAQQRANEEAQKQAAYNNTKKSYGDLLGSQTGKGNTGKSGSQGDPNGDPNSNVLEGISKGSGRVGGGLGNRGVLHEPQIIDKSQKTGRVVISVCVDKSGKVVKAEYTQKGSTTTDSELKEMAKKAALQFKFTMSEIEEQCGTITVDFKVKG